MRLRRLWRLSSPFTDGNKQLQCSSEASVLFETENEKYNESYSVIR